MGRDLDPRWVLGDLDLTAPPFAVQFGSSFGAPQTAYSELSSLLQDGDLVLSDRVENRTIELTVCLMNASDMKDLAEAEAALILRQAHRPRNTLTFDPGDRVGAASVFDTFRAQVELLRNDDEEADFFRRYRVTIPAEPYVRSTQKISRSFTKGATTYTTVDGAASTSGWTATGGTLTTATVGGDACLKLTASTSGDIVARRNSTDLGSATYFAVDVRLENASNLLRDPTHVVVRLADAPWYGALPPVATLTSPVASQFQRFIFERPAGGASIEFAFSSSFLFPLDADHLYIGGIYSANNIPSAAISSATVEGAVRTSGSVSFTKVNEAAVFYTDATMLERGWVPSDPSTWSKCPPGTYALWDGTDGIVGDISTVALNSQQTEVTRIVSGAIRRPRGMFTIGAGRDGRAGTLTWTKAGGGSLNLTGFRLFRIADSDDPYGPSSLLYIDSTDSGLVQVDIPSREFPRGGVWLNGVDATDVCASWGVPVLQPPITGIYISSSNSFTLEYHPRYHTHAVM